MTSETTRKMIEFVNARLDEEERWAKNATQGVWKLWGMDVYADQLDNSNLDDAVKVADVRSSVPGQLRTWNAVHIAAHDPARVLRQCAFLRALLPLAKMEVIDFVDDVWDGEGLAQSLAAIWSDHYAYQKEWNE